MTFRLISMILASTAMVGGAIAQPAATVRTQAQSAPAVAPPATPAPAVATPAPAAVSNYAPFTVPTPAVDIVATLTAAGRFSTLIKAIDAAGLTGTLKQPGKLTLFAPTDEAFAALPAGTLDNLMKPENRSQLQHLLLYHVINAPVTGAETVGHAAADIPTVVPGATPPLTLHVDGSSGALKINGGDVVQLDVKASNGYVQVIDKVLTPPR